MTALSIVIPVYDNWWLTARCLRELAVLRERSGVGFETIVVDNASGDETPRAIVGFPWVRYRRFDTNRNFGGACNAGARMAQSALTLFLNNDAYPLGDALTPLAAAFENPRVAIAGGALFFEDGVTQAAGLVVLRNAHWHYSFRNLPAALDAVNVSRDALGVSGAAMAVRTQWFLDNGGFDESFVNGFEDVDLCLRAREARCTVAYVADSRFAHYEGASAGRYARERENERRFYERWRTAMAALPRTARGSVGAIAIHHAGAEEALLVAARSDLEAALADFGHPISRGSVRPWQRIDRRYREAASIGWFTDRGRSPGISIERKDEGAATIRTRGAAELKVPWLPCASSERVAACALRPSLDPDCRTVGICGGALNDDLGVPVVEVTPAMILGLAPAVDVACIVHCGASDAAHFGSVLLAQAGIPAIVLAEELRAFFARDVSRYAARNELRDAVGELVGNVERRAELGRLLAADARRRFSPRRSAIRIVDLLCAARFGLERAGAARSDTPL